MSDAVSSLAADTTYYWRVRAKEGTTEGPWSEVRAFTTAGPDSASTISLDVWFNEAHYQDSDNPTDKFLEVIVRSTVSPSDFNKLAAVFYEASTGSPAEDPMAPGQPALVPLSSFMAGQTIGNFTFYTLEDDTAPFFANDGDALALCYDVGGGSEAIIENGGVVQFFSQAGTTTALASCAAGRTSTDIGFAEDESTPPGSSIGLTDGPGTPAEGGTSYSDFVPSNFHFPQTDNRNATPGGPNFFQSFFVDVTCPAPFAIDAFLASQAW